MTHSPLGITGAGARAEVIAARIASASAVRVIVHGFQLPAGKVSRVEVAANLFDLASECDVVIAAYETHAQLIQALAGSVDRPGLVTAMAPGALLVDLSGGSPEECRRLAGQLSPRAIGFVECGHVGDEAVLASGEALVFVGGFDAHIAHVMPFLSTLGRVRRIGPQGSGRMYAALSQGIAAAHAVALIEVHAIAVGGGFVPDDLAAPPMLDAERLELARHVEHARAMARSHGVASPVLDAVAAQLSSSERCNDDASN